VWWASGLFEHEFRSTICIIRISTNNALKLDLTEYLFISSNVGSWTCHFGFLEAVVRLVVLLVLGRSVQPLPIHGLKTAFKRRDSKTKILEIVQSRSKNGSRSFTLSHWIKKRMSRLGTVALFKATWSQTAKKGSHSTGHAYYILTTTLSEVD
jgi:hypothetical protein